MRWRLWGQRPRVDSDRRILFPDLCQLASQLCVLRDAAGWTTAGCARSAQQCFATLPLPAVFPYRVCARQNVGAADSAFGDDLGTATDVVLFQAYLEGAGWFVDNLSIASAILIGSVVWILLLALLSQVVSALVKWRVVASGALLGIFFIPSVFGEVINRTISHALGEHHQSGRADEECFSGTVRHICAARPAHMTGLRWCATLWPRNGNERAAAVGFVVRAGCDLHDLPGAAFAQGKSVRSD